MKKLLRHRWIKQPGFRIHKCEYCGIIRYWDAGYQRLMFKWIENGIEKTGYRPPACKRIIHCDKVEI